MSQPASLQRVERREPAAGEEPDPTPHAPPDPLAQRLTRREEVSRACRLEAQQLGQPLVRPVEHRHLEVPAVVGRQVDPPEREVARHVLEEVDQLEPGADVVGGGHELRLVCQLQQTEHEPPDGVGRMHAVVLQVCPRLVLGDALIHPVRLDQAQKRLPRQVEFADGRPQLLHHRPGGLTRVAGLHLPLELVEQRQAVAFGLVAEDVHEPREAVHRPQMRPQRTREEERRDREVLGTRSSGYLGRVHPSSYLCGARGSASNGLSWPR